MKMCIARKGVKDLPILAPSLPAVILAGLPAVLLVRRLSCPPSFLSAVFVAEWRACSPSCQE